MNEDKTVVRTWNWLDSFYEALEFFYLEPQHLRYKTKASSEIEKLKKLVGQSTKLETVLKHLREMEVTLNHNLRQFFLLAPDSFRNRLFTQIFGLSFPDNFVLHGGGVDRHFRLENSMQPDFLFSSAHAVVSIEMKIKSKSSEDQVLKYALLGLAVERQEGEKQHSLILLGVGQLHNFFKKPFATPEDLCQAIAAEDLSAFLKNKPKRFRDEQERLSRIVKEMRVQFVSYAALVQFLNGEMSVENNSSAGAEVYRKLIQGLVDEIKLRNLL